MIRKISCLLITVIVSIVAFAQSFEGKIIYQNSYSSKIPSVTSEQFAVMMGSKQDYSIKGGNYKSVTNGTFVQWQLYINDSNKLYNKMSNSEILFWNDGATNKDEVLKAELNRHAAEILGYSCDELILTCKNGVEKYYFASKLSIDPTLYSRHKYGNWFEYLSRSKALPLKIIIENKQFILESLATEVKPMKLEHSYFLLPANAKTAQSPG